MPYQSVKCGQCPKMIRSVPGSTGFCASCRQRVGSEIPVVATMPEPTPLEQMSADREKVKSAGALAGMKAKYAEALKTIEHLEKDKEVVLGLQAGSRPLVIEPRYRSGTSEGVVVIKASDWHVEERVDPTKINGLNEANLEIIDERIRTFFQADLRLIRLLQQDIKIDTAIIALLGDFISGDIHEEISEVCQLPPMEALLFAEDRIVGGINLLLNNTKLNLEFKCHSGNHGRTTKTTRFSMENGHSLEYLMYRHLAALYKGEKRVFFDVAPGPHSYAEVYGKTLRFQHGHMVKYGGGVGGITIPVNKAIAQWNMARHADLDMFGHFHTQLDGNHFLANGSLIGYNSFALSIKAPFDVPKQTLFLLDKKRGRTCTWPILFAR